MKLHKLLRGLLFAAAVLLALESFTQRVQQFANLQGMVQIYDLAFETEEDVVYVAGSGTTGRGLVVKLDENGDEMWRKTLWFTGGQNQTQIAQEVYVNKAGAVFVSVSKEVGDGEIARLDPHTGDVLWNEKLPETKWASNSQIRLFSGMFSTGDTLGIVVRGRSSRAVLFFTTTIDSPDLKLHTSKAPSHWGFENSENSYVSLIADTIFELNIKGEIRETHIADLNASHGSVIHETENLYYLAVNYIKNGRYSSYYAHVDKESGEIVKKHYLDHHSYDLYQTHQSAKAFVTEKYGLIFPVSMYLKSSPSTGAVMHMQMHPVTCELVWDTLLTDDEAKYAGSSLMYSSGQRHLTISWWNESIYEWKFDEYDWQTGVTPKSETESRVKVYPNPSENAVNFEGVKPDAKIQIYTSTGQLYRELELQENQLNISGYSPGLYFVRLIGSDQKMEVIKFVKQ